MAYYQRLMSALQPLVSWKLPAAMSPSPSQLRVAAAAAAGSSAIAVLVYVNRKSILLWIFDRAILARRVKPGQEYLEGNFAPIKEEKYEACTVVEGKIPTDLNGFYIRTGPNPFFKPIHGYHWFDGDGMLHACRIKDGKVTYCNHFVQTSKLQQEQKSGRVLFTKMGDQRGWLGLFVTLIGSLHVLFGVKDKSQGTGTANTSLQYHANRLLATHEGDLPYVIKLSCNGLIETAGRVQNLPRDKWEIGHFTAHPKLDAKTGELLTFGYSLDKAPYMQVGFLDKEGQLTKAMTVDLPWPVMMHDCAITEKYFVILHLPLCFDPQVMVSENKLPLRFRKDLPSRMGLLDRNATDASGIQWFELPAFMLFHTFNAYDDGDKVKVYACHTSNVDLELHLDAVKDQDQFPVVQQYCLDTKTGKASMKQVSADCGEFPVIHTHLTGRKHRFGWMGLMDRTKTVPLFNGISKLDFDRASQGKDAAISRIMFEPGCYGGEVILAPKHASLGSNNAGEDDGYLLTYVWSEKDNKSYLHIYDAKGMASKPVARVLMPQRVPYGFHSTWVTQQQIKEQKTWL